MDGYLVHAVRQDRGSKAFNECWNRREIEIVTSATAGKPLETIANIEYEVCHVQASIFGTFEHRKTRAPILSPPEARGRWGAVRIFALFRATLIRS